MQSLKPVGLPPESERKLAMNCIISMGVVKAECLAGEMQSWPISTPRISEISLLTFAAGNTPPCPGLAPCESVSSTILICGSVATAANFSGQKLPSLLRQQK